MIHASLDRCFSFINGHSAPKNYQPTGAKRAVTISRQAGCGAQAIAGLLADYLQENSAGQKPAWTVFDRNLMEQVLSDHNLPAYLEKLLPEDRISAIEDTLAEIFGLRPTAQKIIQQTAETMLKIAELGNAIIIGRAGNIVTAKLPHVLQVRLVAPLNDRIERVAYDEHKTISEARKFCVEEELARARYVKKYYGADVDNSLDYHLVLNTSLLGFEATAKLIGDAVLNLPAIRTNSELGLAAVDG